MGITGGKDATRLAGRQCLGVYPLPLAEAKRIQKFFRYPEEPCSALDPCIGEGGAFAEITRKSKAVCYGIELDARRAACARSTADEVTHANCFDVQCPVECFSLIYLSIRSDRVATSDPATGQETPQGLERVTARCAELKFRKRAATECKPP